MYSENGRKVYRSAPQFLKVNLKTKRKKNWAKEEKQRYTATTMLKEESRHRGKKGSRTPYCVPVRLRLKGLALYWSTWA